jgi:3'-5' exoribonuclease
MIDNLGGTLGTFDRIEKSLADGEQWSGYDRALSGSAFFSATRAA